MSGEHIKAHLVFFCKFRNRGITTSHLAAPHSLHFVIATAPPGIATSAHTVLAETAYPEEGLGGIPSFISLLLRYA